MSESFASDALVLAKVRLNTLVVVTDALFGIDSGTEIPVAVALIAVVTLLGICAVVLERRVRAVDVVA